MEPVSPAPRTIGPYRITGELGQGSFATVYRACREDDPQSAVALKIARPDTPAGLLAAEQQIHQRVQHPAVVRVLDADLAHQPPYLVLEFCPGGNLRQLLEREGPLPPERVGEVLDQVLSCLEAAHAAGVAHRDLKPENLLLDAELLVKVADFGLGQISFDERSMLLSQGMRSTGGGAVGTFDYMAPEQKQGKGDHRVDLYALGVICFELLCGRRPDRNDKLDARLTPDAHHFWSGLYERLCTPLLHRIGEAREVRRMLREHREAAARARARPAAPARPATPPQPDARAPRRPTGLAAMLGGVAAVVLVGALVTGGRRAASSDAVARGARVHPVVRLPKPLPAKVLGRAGDAALKDVRLEPGQQALVLAGGRFREFGMLQVARLKKLRGLDLSDCGNLSDLQLTHLIGLPLEQLILAGTRITDAGLQHVARLSKLVLLDLSRTRIRGSGLRELARIPGLAVLVLRECEALESLSLRELRSLKALRVSGLRVRRQDWPGWARWAEQRDLHELDLRGQAGISDAVIREMRQIAPRCRIYW